MSNEKLDPEGWEVISELPSRSNEVLSTRNNTVLRLPNAISGTPVKNQASSEEKDVTGLIASLLIPGKGEPLQDQAILWDRETGKIIYVGTHSKIPMKLWNVHLQPVSVVMPGMWECHSHFMGASSNKPIDSENLAMINPAEAGARNARALKDTLYAGFTSCVDLGGYATELQTVIDEGVILGPTLYGAGAAISMTAGHGDVFEYARR